MLPVIPFDFPPCFGLFQQFLGDLHHQHRIRLNGGALGIYLGGLLQGLENVDGQLDDRYPSDPPELVTMFHGESGGLHWGYYVEDATKGDHFVVSAWDQEPLLLVIEGMNLFEVLRRRLESMYASNQYYLETDGDVGYVERLQELDLIRYVLMAYDTADRPERGTLYTKMYRHRRRVTAATRDRIGIVLDDASLYRPLANAGNYLQQEYMPTIEEIVRDTAEATKLLEEGYPGAMLKLGKDLWWYPHYREMSRPILKTAYTALGRTYPLAILTQIEESL